MNLRNNYFSRYFKIFRYVFYLAWSRNKSRFVKTKIGSFWIGLSTLLTISALAFVYVTVMKVINVKAYIAYIGLGILYWNALSTLVSDFSSLINRSRDRLLSTSINIIDVITEEYIFAVQNLLFSMAMVLPILSAIYPEVIKIFSLKFILGFLIYLIIVLINSLLAATITLFSADLSQLIPVTLQLSFLLSPILYLKDAIRGKEWVFKFNPLYLPIGIVRDSILSQDELPFKFLIKIFSTSLIILISFLYLIRKYSRKINLYIDK